MNAQQISDALGGRPYGDGFRTCCPAHGGDNPTSLSIRDTDDGYVLVHCFAGCSYQDIVVELRQRGLWPEATTEQKKIAAIQNRRHEKEYAEIVVYIAACDSKKGIELTPADKQLVRKALRALKGCSYV